MDSTTTRFTNAERLFLSDDKRNSTDDQYQEDDEDEQEEDKEEEEKGDDKNQIDRKVVTVNKTPLKEK